MILRHRPQSTLPLSNGGLMPVVYKPSTKLVGANARSIEYELLKIQQKLDDLEARVTALGG